MPILKMPGFEEDEKIPAYNRLFLKLEKEREHGGGSKFKNIQSLGQNLVGLIVVAWLDEDDPKEYLIELEKTSFVDHPSDWVGFDNTSIPESPRMYTSLGMILSIVRKLREENTNKKIGIALWKHPKASAQNIAQYGKKAGIKFQTTS